MKIIAYSMGDSNNPATWSNVPFYFIKALEAEGVEVVRVNVQPFSGKRNIRVLINKGLNAFKAGIPFERTSYYKKSVRRKMLKALKENPDADLLLSFDFSSSIADKTDKKTMLFCDWDIKYLITQIDKRTPNEKEQALIEEQSEIIKGADYAVSIFPNAYEKMKEDYANLYYFGTPINLDEPQFDIDGALGERYKNKRLLFIGKKKYLSGIKALYEAVENYNSKNESKFYIDLIGMTQEHTGINSEYVNHYGYLNKNNPEQWKTYNDILRGAFFFVNTTDNWVGASSILDTAYLGIPCIINPNPDLTKTFGDEIFFGYYCRDNTADEIEKYLKRLSELSEEEYTLLSSNARVAVKGYTYPEYIKKILELIKS